MFIFYVKRTRIEIENIPYREVFDNHSELLDLKSKGEPFRVASSDKNITYSLKKYGFETIGARGPIFHKYYKDFIRLVVAPQLENENVREKFDNYWYDLFIVPTR